MIRTHELALIALPTLVGPAYAIRAWAARRKARLEGPLRIGDRLPAWGPLRDTEGRSWGDRDLRGRRATVFVFMSNRCPGIKAYDRRLAKLVADYSSRGVLVLGVNSIPATLYPSESGAHMRAAAAERGLTMPYVKDAEQTLKRLLGAVCTPQAFVVDGRGALRYRGRIDDAFLEPAARSHDLRDALDALLAGRRISRAETPTLGCSIDEAPMHSALIQVQASRPSAGGVRA